MLDNTSQLLLRNHALDSETMLVNAQDSLSTQCTQSSITSHFYYANLFQQFGDSNSSLGPTLIPDIPRAVLYVPKEKALFRMLLDNLAASMAEGTELLLAGSNKSGIKSLVNKLPQAWNSMQKLASGNHCLLFRCVRSASPVPAFELTRYRSHYSVNEALQVSNLPGVFSEKALDAGTRLLLEHIPTTLQGSVLDFACGSGVIGAYLSEHRAVTRLHASDVNVFALQASQWTLAENTTNTPYQVIPSDGLNAITERYDWIVTNPPFHTGQKTDYAIARDFIRQVPARLKPKGRLLLVANNFLGYPELLKDVFSNVQELANNGKFRVLEASRPC